MSSRKREQPPQEYDDDCRGQPLRIGAFYWVQITLDPDYSPGEEWFNARQPARYAGGGKWNYLKVEGDSDWPVIWVGDEITPP